ncbi:MAG TPA: phosphoribosylanthranilate isomerase [Defluviitaleaceae bacterium]|jgi:phosphoribosylanthranilate isomerase|nr:phosphoribosylanthranilate isomerase [Defluviitaleaceae bacterium]
MLTMPEIKICGLKSVEQIYMINKYDIDYVGFVFAESKRQVTPELAKEMRSKLRRGIKAVGVFVDTPIEEVNQIAKYCHLDIVQLHGNEKDDECSRSIVPVWKALSVQDKEVLNRLEEYKAIQGFVFDSGKGGSGKTFSWDLIKGISSKYFTILAGGLNSENVVQGIREVNPHIVDVSSGVESKGEKDESKIKAFIKAVKTCNTFYENYPHL